MAKSITKDMTEGNPFPLILKFSIFKVFNSADSGEFVSTVI